MRHPLTLLTREVPLITVRPDTTSVLIQDIHPAFTDHENGFLAVDARNKVLSREFDEFTAELDLAKPGFRLLAEAAHYTGIPVLYSCLGYLPPESPSAFQIATGWNWDVSNASVEIASLVAPATVKPENVFSKPAWGALSNRDLATKLETMNSTSVILAGTMLEYGIQQTAYQLQDHGIGVIVVSDGVVGLTQAGKSQVSGTMLHGLIKARSLAELHDIFDRVRSEGEAVI